MRALAWLQTVPRPPQDSKRAQATEPNKHTRLELMRMQGAEPQMPRNPMPQLMTWFVEIGMVENTGMGPAPLSWREIEAWQRAVGVSLDPWRARLIRQLSIEFIAEKGRAEDENCPAPWVSRASDAERRAEEKELRALLG